MFHGIITALITPFKDNKIDDNAFKNLVNWQIEKGIDGLVVGGTTGESALLSEAELIYLWEMAVEMSHGRVPMIAYSGALCIDESIRLTQLAKDKGFTAALILTPPYIKPSQESLIYYYKTIAEAVDIPIILYNNPSRTGVNLDIKSVEELARVKNIIGMKDATSHLERVTHFKTVLGDDFLLFGGDDIVYPAYKAMGGDGLISAASNIAPEIFLALEQAWRLGDMTEWARLRNMMFPLIEALSVAANPFPLKFAASLLGNVTLESRLPFVPLDAAAQEAIRSALKTAGVWHESPTLNVAPA